MTKLDLAVPGSSKQYYRYISDKSAEERVKWIQAQPEIIEWFRKHPAYAGVKSQGSIINPLFDFLEYLIVDSDSPLKECRTFKEMLDRLDEMKTREHREVARYLFGFINDMQILRNSKVTYFNKIRSLFRQAAPDMRFMDGERLPWTDKPSDLRKSFQATKKDYLRVLSCVDEPRWRSVFICKGQMMVGEVEFVNFSNEGWPLIRDQYLAGKSLNGRTDTVVFTMPARPKIVAKGALPYVTSIERDGIRELRNYFETERGLPKPGEAIWLTEKDNPLSVRALSLAWGRYLRKSGVIKPYAPACPNCGATLRLKKPLLENGSRPHYWHCRSCGKMFRRSELVKEPSTREISRIRYDFGQHEMSRDLWASELEIAYYRTSVPSWVTHMRMGRTSKIDSNNYQRSLQKNLAFAEELFETISPWLNWLSEDPDRVDVKRVEELEKGIELAKKERDAEIDSLRREAESRNVELADMQAWRRNAEKVIGMLDPYIRKERQREFNKEHQNKKGVKDQKK